MTSKEVVETTKEVAAVGLWMGLFVFAIMVGLVVGDRTVVF